MPFKEKSDYFHLMRPQTKNNSNFSSKMPPNKSSISFIHYDSTTNIQFFSSFIPFPTKNQIFHPLQPPNQNLQIFHLL